MADKNQRAPSREEEASQALHELLVGLVDIRDILQFVIEHGPLGNEDFDRGVAAAVSMSHMRAVALCRLVEEVR
ncbi:hypothetical protein QEG23_000238 [Stenotrophomonas maltophilia]|uniref:Uncharacterized protein n=1 Tax=Stenotrophomonas maltophilia TaxID=40324 RepID=A0AAI9BYC1_STEMA|nr:hypothetical protein [Stenotrophomonas maltophilia]